MWQPSSLPSLIQLLLMLIKTSEQDSMDPYVFIAYSSAHFDLSQTTQGRGDTGDLEQLLAIATKAAALFRPMPDDLRKHPRAFWIAANCMPPGQIVDENGRVRDIDTTTEVGMRRKQILPTEM